MRWAIKNGSKLDIAVNWSLRGQKSSVLLQGGCEGGDEVEDTPAAAYPTYTCPHTPVDSCPDQPGFDPLHNYMGCKYLQQYADSFLYNNICSWKK